MSKKKKTFIFSLLIVLFYLLLSCENPMVISILPDVDDGAIEDTVSQENSYTVFYNANGGEGEMKASVFTVGVWENLPPNIFIREGYVFTGWAVWGDGGVEYADKAAVNDLAAAGETVTLYAKWGNDVYIVVYDANGGEGHMAPGIVTLGQEYTLTANTFIRNGFLFTGWSLLNNGEVHFEDEAVIQNADDITGETIRFYAVWLPDKDVAWPAEMYAAYGQTLSDLWLPDDAYNRIPGAFTWAAPGDFVGNVGVHLHRMVFTPEDTVNNDIEIQDIKIIVYPKFVDITGTPGRTLIPFDSADTLYGKTSTLEITLDGLLGGDTVTLAINEGYGLSLSGNTGIGNKAQRTINVNYDGITTINESGPVSLELYISDNDNYILDGSGFELTILDGQTESRAIPVTQASIASLISYANTESGLARHYKLVQNLTPGNWETIGTNAGQFTGSFDGNGFTISNLTINKTAAYQGIFGSIGTGGVVKNIGIVNGNIGGRDYTGGIAGYNNGTIQNCYVTGSVSGGDYTGGIAGYNNGTIQNCYSTSTVSGSSNVGGVAGQNNNKVQNCYATGRISGTNYIGGVVGSGGTVRNCSALNSIITTSGASAGIGRVVGTGSSSSNYARSDMIVKYNWNGSTGTNKTITTTGIYNGIDGSGVSPEQYNTQSWWITAGNWYSGNAWNFTNIWEMNVNNIPKLKTAGGSQNHELPAGDGTEGNPFRVYNEATLKKVGTGTDGWGLDKQYRQIQDITLALPAAGQSNLTAIGTDNNRFTGVYDGGGYAISNLTINTTANYQGMFGCIGTGGIAKNIGLIGGSISGGSSTGGMAGDNYGTIQNCYATGNISGNNGVGGLAGDNYGTIQNCYATGNISGNNGIGGVAGDNKSTIQNCYATGNVSGSLYSGGVVGYNSSTMQNCYAMGNVSGSYFIGGIVGMNIGTVRNCSALNSMVTTSYANTNIGRVAGSFPSGTMSSNYARGDMTVKYSWNGSTGTNKPLNTGLAAVDGANIGPGQYNAQSWWQNTANWTGGAWNFTGTWEMNTNNLPKLKNTGGIQDHFVLTGDGTETNPFTVYDVDTLRKVGSGIDDWGLNKHYRQVQDITLTLPATGQSNWETIGTSARQFTGSYDGNGSTISNLTINKTAAYQGVFGSIGTGGVVKNIGVVNGNISGRDYTGGIAGYNNGTIQNCYVTGSVSGGDYTGGIAGYNNGTIQNCYSTSTVSGSSNVGGVAGQNNNMVQNCYATGRISGTNYIGGVVGNGGTVRNCVALNPGVTTSGSNGTVGRVVGTGSGSNNHARNDMVVKYNWKGLNGTNKTISAGLTTNDGANITATQWNNSSWWQSTAVWNFTSIWIMNVNNFPKLRDAGGVQNHALSVYVDFMEMVWVPAGSFTMGSPANEADRFDDEGPQRTVTLTGFYMGKYTVTQEQYQAVMGTNPSGFKAAAAGENAARLPVEQVTWYDAVEFCNKLSQLEGLTPVYTISGRTPATGYPVTNATVTANLSRNGYRLPTEAQWEYACRAGTSTAYYTGATINNNTGWYNANSMNTTHEVGKKPANARGLYDMHGNVWEWCGDWFGNYSSGAQSNPTGASSGATRVTRGGSWYSSPQGVRSACRNGDNPSKQFANLGFRIVRP